MKIFKCILDSVRQDEMGSFRLRVKMKEDNHSALAFEGEYVITSAVKVIDFERGYAITRNNIYKWKD